MGERDEHLIDWAEIAERELGREPEPWTSAEGIDVKALYRSDDVAGLPHLDGVPGTFPFVRGPYATMYTGKPWTVRQYAGFSTAEESNQFYKRCLTGGQHGLSVAFDLPTHRGYDSDHPRARGDVGKAGVAIDSVEDMARLFDGIALDRVSVSMTMNGAVLPVLAAFIVAAEESGVPRDRLRGTIQNDILKEFSVRNTFIHAPEPSMKIVADVIAYASREMPRYNSVSISGYHMHEAGAPADLELAFTIATGLEYVRAAISAGLAVDDFAPRLSFFFATGMNLFMEVAKLRAARWLWATLVRRQFSPSDERSTMLRMHCQTSGVSLTASDPLNNVVRTTVEGLAAVLGGTQSLHTNAYDEALALPSDAAARVARNTQLILQHEAELTHVVDPLAGSYYVESLTSSLAERALSVIDEVESMGGMTRAVEAGLPKQRIETAAVRRQARLDEGRDVVVGVNRFQPPTEREPELRRVDHEQVQRVQAEHLASLRRRRDDGAVRAALDGVVGAARAGTGLLEASVVAMRARATVGEVCASFEQVWPRYRPRAPIAVGVYAGSRMQSATWKAVVERVRRFEEREGRRPRMLVVKLGQDGHDRGARVVASAFADVGFDVDLAPMFLEPEEAAQHAIDNDVHVVGVSSHTGAHDSLVPRLLDALAASGAEDVAVVCGGVIPEADRIRLEAAGVAATFGPGTSIDESAGRVLDVLEQRRRHGVGGPT